MYVDLAVFEFVFGYWGLRTGYFTLIRYFKEGPLEPGYVLGREKQIALTDRIV